MNTGEQLRDMAFYRYFLEISAIPRGSGNEQAVSEYLVRFAAERKLRCVRDKRNNVVIRKPGAGGREADMPLILQSHMDMVCEKEPGSNHDFLRDPIVVMEKDGFLCADGTTLGADNAVGMAYTLALLADNALPHPPLEALFTTGEEVGMEGMAALDASALLGKRMLNLDAEAEGIFFASCAGGERLFLELPAETEPAPSDAAAYTVEVGGLRGGHSGLDIDKGRGNAIQLLARALYRLQGEIPVRIQKISGGQKTNSIPRQAAALVWLPPELEKAAGKALAEVREVIAGELDGNDPRIELLLRPTTPVGGKVLVPAIQQRVLAAILLLPCGPLGYSPDLAGVVESSCSLGLVETGPECIRLSALARANRNSRLDDTAMRLDLLATALRAKSYTRNRYTAWEYHAKSPLRMQCEQVYERLYCAHPAVASIHAGLECALMAEKRPEIDMVAIGANLFDAHTPDERVEIASLVRTWHFLRELLRSL